jgi:hypothetical protein
MLSTPRLPTSRIPRSYLKTLNEMHHRSNQNRTFSMYSFDDRVFEEEKTPSYVVFRCLNLHQCYFRQISTSAPTTTKIQT